MREKMLKRTIGLKYSRQQGQSLVEICGIPQLEVTQKSKVEEFNQVLKKPR